MDNQEVTLTLKEQKRLHVLNQIEAGEITVEKGAELLGITERHLYRLKASYREHGAKVLAHGNRGRPSPRLLPAGIRLQVVELVRSTYRSFNDHHLTEMLRENHGIQISRSSVRRLRREAGVPSPRKRRAPKHRSRRPRYPRPGMLLQIDGSEHPWLGDRGPWLTLVAAIDDATGEVPEAIFRAQEDAAGYFLLTRRIVERLGLPLAYYADRHSIFRSPKQASVEQQMAGEAPNSQFGRLVDELGIELIASFSPQGRGRIERLFGTFQDRLVNEMAVAEVSTLEEANRFLPAFLLRFSASFAKPPAEAKSAYLPLPSELDLEAVFCFKHSRKVRTDNTISFAGHVLQIPPDRHRGNYARCQVEVRQHMDGRLSVWYQGRELVAFEPEEAGPPRVGKFTPAVKTVVREMPTNRKQKQTKLSKKRIPWKPAADHPWRRSFKISAKGKD